MNMSSTFNLNNLNTLNIITQSNKKIEQYVFKMFENSPTDNAHSENSHTRFSFVLILRIFELQTLFHDFNIRQLLTYDDFYYASITKN